MNEGFNNVVKRAVKTALRKAETKKQACTTAHLVMGLLNEERSIFVRTLRDWDTNLERLMQQIDEELENTRSLLPNEQPAFSDATKAALDEAMTIAKEDGRSVDTGDILCGLAKVRYATILSILADADLSPDEVRRDTNIIRLLGSDQ